MEPVAGATIPILTRRRQTSIWRLLDIGDEATNRLANLGGSSAVVIGAHRVAREVTMALTASDSSTLLPLSASGFFALPVDVCCGVRAGWTSVGWFVVLTVTIGPLGGGPGGMVSQDAAERARGTVQSKEVRIVLLQSLECFRIRIAEPLFWGKP